MKKIIAIALAAVMLLSLAGCGETEKAEGAVAGLFEAFKAGDFEKAEEYLLKDETSEEASEDDMFNHIFTKLDYTIDASEKINGKEVHVTASVTAPDMKVAYASFFEKALEFAFSSSVVDEPISESEYEKALEKILAEETDREDLGTVTNTVTIKVVKTAEGWKVESDNAFADAITGGLMTAMRDMQQTMMESE